MKTIGEQSVNKARQQGAALIISLLVLVAMTVIGISTMRGALLEVKMAGNAQQQVVATRQVERVLLAAEQRIEALVADSAAFEFGTANDGFYLPTDAVAVSNPSWSGVTAENGPTVDGTVIGQYVVEYHGPKAIPGETIKLDTEGRIIGGAVYTYRNSVRSSPRPGAVRIVQSLYTTRDAP